MIKKVHFWNILIVRKSRQRFKTNFGSRNKNRWLRKIKIDGYMKINLRFFLGSYIVNIYVYLYIMGYTELPWYCSLIFASYLPLLLFLENPCIHTYTLVLKLGDVLALICVLSYTYEDKCVARCKCVSVNDIAIQANASFS